MVNQNYGHENDAHEPRGSGAGLLIGGLLIGLLVGGLTGALVMLLVAPRSGKRTRAKLQRQAPNGASRRLTPSAMRRRRRRTKPARSRTT